MHDNSAFDKDQEALTTYLPLFNSDTLTKSIIGIHDQIKNNLATIDTAKAKNIAILHTNDVNKVNDPLGVQKKLTQTDSLSFYRDLKSQSKILEKIHFDFRDPEKEAKQLYKLYRNSDNLEEALLHLAENDFGDDHIKSIQNLVAHLQGGFEDQRSISKKEFVNEYKHLSKFAEKHPSLNGNNLIQEIIKDRNMEQDMLNRYQYFLDVANAENIDNNYHQHINSYVKRLLSDEQFQMLNSQDKNRLLHSLNQLNTINEKDLDQLLRSGDYNDLQDIFTNAENINDTVLSQLQTLDISEVQSRIEAFDETKEFDKHFNKIVEQENWQDGGFESLPSLNSQLIKTELIQEFDSADQKTIDSLNQYLEILEKYNTKDEIKEEGIEEVKLQEERVKGFLPKNTYIDFIIGYAQGEHSVLNLSPNFGYNFTPGFSAGIGITFQHTFDDHAYLNSVLGYKTFGKFEFFKKRLFVIAENVFLFPGISYFNPDEGVEQFEFTTLIGGGYALNIFKQKVLTISIHYNFNDDMPAPALSSPLLMRFGIDIF